MELQKLYTKTFENQLLGLLNEIKSILEKEPKRKLVYRVQDCKEDLYKYEYIYNDHSYTTGLFISYDRYNIEYGHDVSDFIARKWPSLKRTYIDQGSKSKYLKLSEKKTVGFIAQRDAYKKILAAINDLELSGKENVPEVIEKLRDYEPSWKKKFIVQSDISNTSFEYTENRQILAIYYILKALKLSEYTSKVKISKLAHLLAAEDIPKKADGKDNPDNSRLYQKVKSEWNTRDNKKSIEELLFLKDVFGSLATKDSKGLNEILELINKDIAKSSIKKNG